LGAGRCRHGRGAAGCSCCCCGQEIFSAIEPRERTSKLSESEGKQLSEWLR
jgi:hypothetical protein